MNETGECQDATDNDGDTATDFPDDPGCSSLTDTDELGTNECDDGTDNDGDTVTDILDPACFGDPSGLNETGECQDTLDNDGDTTTDFPDDPGCTGFSDADELGTNECDDGLDNDGDTAADYPNDPGCFSLIDANELGANECDDGVDNDGDTYTDFPKDPGCIDINEDNELGANECDDGVDNDGDTVKDVLDPECNNDPAGLTEIGECRDGSDNDGDTLTDYPTDPGCTDAGDVSEFGTNECDDGVDNDGDTNADYPSDLGCADIIDTSELGLLALAGFYDLLSFPQAVFVTGNYAYVADYALGGLQIIDISDPSSLTLAGSYDTPGVATDVFVSGNYAYVADMDSGLQIIDISIPSSPTLTGSYDTPGFAYGVFVKNNYAYVADASSGLQIIDVSNPASPAFIGAYDSLISLSWKVFVSGNYAFLADGLDGLKIIDVTDPYSPALVGWYNTPDYARSVFVSGELAFVADDMGLQIIDVSIPSSPTLAGSYNTPGQAWDVFVSGNYAFVADFRSGLQVIDISIPSSPAFFISYDLPAIHTVFIKRDYAFVAKGGLKVIFTDASICSDFLDNDGDTLTDYPADPGCTSARDPNETIECDDGVDNDGDGLTDFPSDPGCTSITDASELGTNACDNGLDDDGDQFIDYPSDPGCSAITDIDELGTNECDDGVDNDGDTFIDFSDPACYNGPVGLTETGRCQDGLDNDGDTLTDWPSDPECVSAAYLCENATDIGIYVWADSPSPIEDGSFGNPFKSIQAAIDAATSGQYVLVALGTYDENVGGKSGVALKGGYNPGFCSRDPDVNLSIITGSVGSLGTYTGYTDMVIDGFEIGGIEFFNSSSITISNNHIAYHVYIIQESYGSFNLSNNIIEGELYISLMASGYSLDVIVRSSEIYGGLSIYSNFNFDIYYYPTVEVDVSIYNSLIEGGIDISSDALSYAKWLSREARAYLSISNSIVRAPGIGIMISASAIASAFSPGLCGTIAEVYAYSIVSLNGTTIDAPTPVLTDEYQYVEGNCAWAEATASYYY